MIFTYFLSCGCSPATYGQIESDNLEKILCGDLSQISEEIQEKYISKLRCIPFSSLGKQNGMLLGIRADEIQIETEDEKKTSNNVIIGIYDKEELKIEDITKETMLEGTERKRS